MSKKLKDADLKRRNGLLLSTLSSVLRNELLDWLVQIVHVYAQLTRHRYQRQFDDISVCIEARYAQIHEIDASHEGGTHFRLLCTDPDQRPGYIWDRHSEHRARWWRCKDDVSGWRMTRRECEWFEPHCPYWKQLRDPRWVVGAVVAFDLVVFQHADSRWIRGHAILPGTATGESENLISVDQRYSERYYAWKHALHLAACDKCRTKEMRRKTQDVCSSDTHEYAIPTAEEIDAIVG